MQTILTVYRKELKDILRDRRTLVMMVIIPFVLFPLMFTVMGKVQTSARQKARQRTLAVGLVTRGNAAGLRDSLAQRGDLRLREDVSADLIEPLVQTGGLDAAVVVAPDFDQQVAASARGGIEVYFKSSENLNASRSRILAVIRSFENGLVEARLKQEGLSPAVIRPVNVRQHDLATMQEKSGRFLGGFLPYVFVIFCFMGSMYPALDLGVGEKERKTIETLLASPARRSHILAGKLLTVATTGIGSATVAMAGLFTAAAQKRLLPPELRDITAGLFDPAAVGLTLTLLIPLAVFFAAMLLSASFYARSHKEAQSIAGPLSFVVILPVAFGLTPGIELTWWTAMIPVLNVSLATKEIIAGTIDPMLLAVVYLTLLVLAVGGLAACRYWYQREDVIFRGN